MTPGPGPSVIGGRTLRRSVRVERPQLRQGLRPGRRDDRQALRGAGQRDVQILQALRGPLHDAVRIDEHDLVVGHGEEEWFGTVADVEGLGGGGFAVRDERERVVRVFDSQGRRVATLGRPGMGPVSFGSRGP